MGKTRDMENKQFLRVMNGLLKFESEVITKYSNEDVKSQVLNHPAQGDF